ncbi:MAG: hypothetical protein ACI8ZO_001078 [Flavobacteriales bacterium]
MYSYSGRLNARHFIDLPIMKKVLVITYYWPPASGPGVQRWVKFSKYLRDFGWDPVILTIANGSYPSSDESLANDLPEDLQVFKTRTIEPFALYAKLMGQKDNKLPIGYAGEENKGIIGKIAQKIRANLFIPDARIGWTPFAYAKAAKIITEQEIDTIITTGPPHSTHLIGRKLKRLGNLKWIADFRDPWTNIYYNKQLPKSKRSIIKDHKLETSVIKECDQLITVTPGLVSEFKNRKKGINLIFNGYDPEDFEGIQQVTDSKFSLSYIGNLKASQNCKVFWEVLSDLIKTNQEFKEDFELRLIGNTNPAIKKELLELNLDSNIKFEEFVPHHVAIQKMKNSQMLFFIVPEVENNDILLTGKIFEYLASTTPLFSVGPKGGNAAKIISECKHQEMIDYADKNELKSAVLANYLHWKENNNALPKHKGNVHLKYSRKGLTEQLSKVLHCK